MTERQRIIPCLWFDSGAEEATAFYVSLFSDSGIEGVTRYGEEGQEITGKPPGTVMTVDFALAGYHFVALNGGPDFAFTPAISFYVTCQTEAEVNALWERLIDGGSALMELGAYDWAARYGWVRDRFGLTWQITLGSTDDAGQRITPALLFVGEQHARAEEAIGLYSSIFEGSGVEAIARYPAGGPVSEGAVMYARFALGGETFIAMDGGPDHDFSFSEAVSFQILCDSQDEIDHFWARLTGDGGEEVQCGWLKDRFGVSWQVVPTVLQTYLGDPDPERVARVMRAILQMVKLDIAALRRAYEG